MNVSEQQPIKRIDGIYRSTKASRSPIQVELPLEVPKKVNVTWSNSKPAQPKPQNDNFYVVATAAFTGSKLDTQTRTRLKRAHRRSEQPTIKQAMERQQVKMAAARTHRIGNLFKKISQKLSQAALKLGALTRVTYKHLSTIVNRSRQQQSQRVTHAKLTAPIIILLVTVLILATTLVYTINSFNQYRSNLESSQQAQQDKEWNELRSNWQCITDKWTKMQANQTATNEQKEIQC